MQDGDRSDPQGFRFLVIFFVGSAASAFANS
jgi:hypothetical protein